MSNRSARRSRLRAYPSRFHLSAATEAVHVQTMLKRAPCLASALFLSLGGTIPARAQSAGALVTLTVQGDDLYTRAHVIVIEPDTFINAETRRQIEQRRWRAIRTSEGRTDRINSDQCPALRDAAITFDAISKGPFRTAAFSTRAESERTAPSLRDGFSTEVEYSVKDSQGGFANFTARAGFFAIWGNKTVGELLTCWEPLIPPPPVDVTAQNLLLRLDLNSFDNSTGPDRGEGRRYPLDWGFTKSTGSTETAWLERPNAWVLGLRIIRWTPEGVVACFTDHATTAAYDARSTLRLVNDGLAGFKAAEVLPADPTCLPVPGQG